MSAATELVTAHGYKRYSNPGKPCRCDVCRAAAREYRRAHRASMLASGRLTHGLRCAYDAGCRCDECRAARAAASRREVAQTRKSENAHK